MILTAVRNRDTAAVARLVAALGRETGAYAEPFDPALVDGLPAPARRYLLHAIRPGTPLSQVVRLAMVGEIRPGPRLPWIPFRARQVLAPSVGFAWEATAGRGLIRFAGADTYIHGRGRTVFRLWDLIPLVRAGGPDVSRAARGRLAIESIWQPASLLPQRGVHWAAVDDQTARATVTIDREAIPLTVTVAPDGRLRSVHMDRWGHLTSDGRYAPIPFGADAVEEAAVGGYTVPSRLRVRWWYGTSQAFEFFRARLSRATYLHIPAAEEKLFQQDSTPSRWR